MDHTRREFPCIAYALHRACPGKFETVAAAVEELDSATPIVRPILQKNCPRFTEEWMGEAGETWGLQVVNYVLRLKGVHVRKLRTGMRRGGITPRGTFYLEGYPNSTLLVPETGEQLTINHGEARRNGEWRHAVAVVDGKVLDNNGHTYSLSALYLDEHRRDVQRNHANHALFHTISLIYKLS